MVNNNQYFYSKNHQKRSIYNLMIEIASVIALLLSFYPLLFYSDLSTEVPMHYNLSGDVDRWGAKDSLLIGPLVALITYIIFSIAERYPKMLNLPCKITEKNASYVNRMAKQLCKHIKFFGILLSTHICNATYFIAIGECTKMNPYINFLLLLGGILSIVFFYVKVKTYKPKS